MDSFQSEGTALSVNDLLNISDIGRHSCSDNFTCVECFLMMKLFLKKLARKERIEETGRSCKDLDHQNYAFET